MNLAKYRHKWEMTQQDLSHTTGISIRQIRDIESGKVNVRHLHADTAIRLSRALGVSVEQLLGVVGEKDDGSLYYESDFVWPTFSPDPADKDV